jgi:hypothetical protein
LFLELSLAGSTQGYVGSLSHITQRCSLHIRLSFHSVLSQAADGSNGEKCSQRDGEPECLGQSSGAEANGKSASQNSLFIRHRKKKSLYLKCTQWLGLVPFLAFWHA